MLSPRSYREQLRQGTLYGSTIERGWTSARLAIESGAVPITRMDGCPFCAGLGYFMAGGAQFVCIM